MLKQIALLIIIVLRLMYQPSNVQQSSVAFFNHNLKTVKSCMAGPAILLFSGLTPSGSSGIYPLAVKENSDNYYINYCLIRFNSKKHPCIDLLTAPHHNL